MNLAGNCLRRRSWSRRRSGDPGWNHEGRCACRARHLYPCRSRRASSKVACLELALLIQAQLWCRLNEQVIKALISFPGRQPSTCCEFHFNVALMEDFDVIELWCMLQWASNRLLLLCAELRGPFDFFFVLQGGFGEIGLTQRNHLWPVRRRWATGALP